MPTYLFAKKIIYIIELNTFYCINVQRNWLQLLATYRTFPNINYSPLAIHENSPENE